MAIFEINVPPFYGKFEGGVFYDHNAKFCWRQSTSIANRKTSPLFHSRTNWALSSWRWHDLDPGRRAMWGTYGSALPAPLSGHAAFMQINFQRLFSFGSGLEMILEPPGVIPPPPSFPTFYTVSSIVSDVVNVSWDIGLPSSEFAQIFINSLPSSSQKPEIAAAYHACTFSSVASFDIDIINFPSNTILYFPARWYNAYQTYSTWRSGFFHKL